MAIIIVIVAALGAWYLGALDWFSAYTYRAEVGYYEGTQQQWYVGSDKSREDCVREAIARYNALNAISPNRAFSWACRQMQGERFLTRVR